jgi:hypothetical protein
MALNTSSLTAFVDEISGGIAKQIVLEANTVKGNITDVRYGAKGTEYALNSIKSDMIAIGGTCSAFADTGSTIMGQTKIKICPVKIANEICLDKLNDFYYSWYMEQQYNTESLGSFEEVFYANKIESSAKVLDSILWRGAATGPKYAATTGNLTLCDGFLQNAYANSAVTTNITRTAITASNAVQILDVILNSVATNTPEIVEDFNVYLSPGDFQAYLAGLRNLNLYNYNTQSEGISQILHPGSIGMKVVKTNGLQGATSGTFIATHKANIVTIMSDAADLDFKVYYDNNADALRMYSKIKLGAGFIFPELVTRSA